MHIKRGSTHGQKVDESHHGYYKEMLQHHKCESMQIRWEVR